MWSQIRIPLCFALLTALSACGGGGTSSLADKGSSNAIISGANVAPVIVDSGPSPSVFTTVNEVFTSVTICDSANNCQTIDHILVDTGSSGLRIISSVLSSNLNLSNEQDTGGNNVGACGMFVDGYTWGPVKLATIKIADETTALQIPIQVIGDSSFTTVPNTCSSTGPAENTVASFGANGVLGIGYFQQDCGPGCANIATPVYYSCTATTCTQTALPTAQQITNPVSQFAVDNNGVMLSLPSLPATGAANVAGSLVFGIGTQSNNALNGAQIFTVDPTFGYLTTQFNNQTLSSSFIDSGSNGLYFDNSTLPALTACPTSYSYFYCPSNTQNYTAVIKGANTNQTTVDFSVANATNLFSTYNTGFDDLAGTGVGGFDWGLPFFYGRKVFVVIEGQAVGGSVGPFIAF